MDFGLFKILGFDFMQRELIDYLFKTLAGGPTLGSNSNVHVLFLHNISLKLTWKVLYMYHWRRQPYFF